ncbi:CapA family protein [Paenibacillus sacheonensis]|uniref:CapA family protein n=1 Tax=Paenibacillus sacheonensis TaxID=742054 RepID=A0A7X4YN12_9BACL|nr:CapA family protein [Paenibacillus sacheonensis]MBM7564835.1 poly-gamma-glutamate synthesis protein (capsule biosynthesis protein) [Paenibacillus sacheonensis]NBC69383.1 CapA family protein [Paenibacillus sacheonensis]
MATITVAAVGDLLMRGVIIDSARRTDRAGKKESYAFRPIFAKVVPHLRRPDVTIGNLETTLSGQRWFKQGAGKPYKYERISRFGNPMFNCPDELAGTLKQIGFDILTTANNHCMDGGSAGLKRTLRVLDRHGLRHTGTARTPKESRRLLIVRAKGIKLGILAYTYGTNKFSVPEPWLVNRIQDERIVADLKRLKKRTDAIIVCMHFGTEYKRTPNDKQRRLVRLLLKHGANAVLGAHPHVLQTVTTSMTQDIDGKVRRRVAAYSLGNFISDRLYGNAHTLHGMILTLTLRKDRSGKTDITKVRRLRTTSKQSSANGRSVFRIVPR